MRSVCIGQKLLCFPSDEPLLLQAMPAPAVFTFTSRLSRFGLALILAATASIVHALSVIAPSFTELVDEAAQIVRVEVLETSARLSTTTHGPVIHTFVRCRVLRWLKGEAAGQEFTLQLQGGEVGDLRMEVPGMPQFKAGDRCLLFVEKNGAAFCPLVGVMHGRYHVVTDPATGVEHVLRNNREPLRATADVALPMGHGAIRQSAAESGALTLAAFESAIDGKVRELATHASRK
jgi:hypothetical protein